MRTPVEDAAITRLPVLGGVDSLRASYRDHQFPRHSHDTFAIGVFEKGGAEIHCEGALFTADCRTILTINPGAVHSARSADDATWHYRAFYPTCQAVQEVLAEAELATLAPWFARPMREDPRLALLIRDALVAIESAPDQLGREELMPRIVQGLWTPGDTATDLRRSAPVSVVRGRAFIEANTHRPLTLGEVAKAAGASRYHLVRTFTAALGLSPYAYYLQRRIGAARELLGRGLPPSAVSTMCGFADQSHLTRQFKRIVGVTPGEYSTAHRGGSRPQRWA